MKKYLTLILTFVFLTTGFSINLSAKTYIKGPGISGTDKVNGSSGWVSLTRVSSAGSKTIKASFNAGAFEKLKNAKNGRYNLVETKTSSDYLTITMTNCIFEMDPKGKSFTLGYSKMEGVSHTSGGGDRTLTKQELSSLF